MEQQEEQRRKLWYIGYILNQLPVKTLLRCRCLSRSQRWLIDQSNFSVWYSSLSANHITRSRRLFLQLYPRPPAAAAAAAVAVSPIGYCSYSPQTYTGLTVPARHSVMGGSCRGVICIASSPFHVCLWNPSTRTHRHLIPPNYQHLDGVYRYVCFGLGFDGRRNLKLVRLVFSYSPETRAFRGEASVCTLRTDIWQTIDCQITWPANSYGDELKEPRECGWELGKSGVFVSDRIKWVIKHHGTTHNGAGRFSIISLDLKNQNFSTQSVPKFMIEGRSSDSLLLEMDMWAFGLADCLSLNFGGESCEVVIWVKEGEKWSKMFRVEGFFWRLKPLFYSAFTKKIILLQMDSKLVWYDLRIQNYWDANVLQEGTDLYEATAYVDGCELIDGAKRCVHS